MDNRRCPGCMKLTSERVCEHCGWPADGNNDPHQLPVGTVLQGKYLIGRVLGQGGFGITYMGWDMNLDIQVCIKEFYPSSTVNRDVTRSTVVNCNTTNMEGYYTACLERFLREGKALAKFRNVPQIVGIHDFFQVNNTAYMVMEFVSGIDLAKYVQKRGGRLHMDEILKILKPVMEALQLVHDAGIIHRDISPDNIMLEPREGAKLLDFGAVRSVEHPDAEKELTRATEAILKNGFAPMEQYVAKGSLGPWTDVYAMSATIYYCLTGRIPEDAPIRVMEGTLLDWSGAQGLTEHQKAVLEQGMEPKAKDRIASIRELMDKLYTPEEAQASAPVLQPKKDPLRTELITEFKVNVPQPEPAPAAKEPAAAVFAEPAPTPAVTELASTPVVKEPGPTPVVPTVSQPRQKDRSLWGHVVFMVVLVVAVLAAIFLLPKKDEAQIPTVSNQQATIKPTTKPTEPPIEPTEPPTELPTWMSEPWAGNIMVADPFGTMGIERTTVTNVIFMDSKASAPGNAVDVSADRSGKVLGWADGTDAYFAADGGINGEKCCRGLFEECTELLNITFGGAFHTDGAISMHRMFYNCNNLQTVDVEHLNTSNVVDMSFMFVCCFDLRNLEVSRWDTSNVVDMDCIFSEMHIEALDVSDWNVSNVRSMEAMFAAMDKLKTLNLSRWDTSRVVSMYTMFIQANPNIVLELGNWETDSVMHFEFFMDDGRKVNGKPWEELFYSSIPGGAVGCVEDGVTHYYFMYMSYSMTWEEANSFCNKLGGHLATPTTPLQNETAFSAIDPDYYYTSVYFGMTDAGSYGNWRWITGEPFDYAPWHAGEPSEYSANEDYGCYYPDFKDSSWNDGNYQSEGIKLFICEWDIPQ